MFFYVEWIWNYGGIRSGGRADGRTDGRADGRTDGRADGRTVWQHPNNSFIKLATLAEKVDWTIL